MNSTTGTSGGDDMAFVIHFDRQPSTIGTVGNRAVGDHASACGYGIFPTSVSGVSVDNSLVIELDCFNNGAQPAAAPINDPDDNHVSIHPRGVGDNSHIEDFSIGRADTTVLGDDLNNGLDHRMRVLYVPGTLTVFLDGSQILSVSYNFTTGGTFISS